MRVRLFTLGRFTLAIDGVSDASIVGQPVRASLLVHVAVERETTRQALAALLWPDSDDGRARHVLSQTLYQLRGDLGEGVLVAEREVVRAGPELWVDAVEFREAVEGGRWSDAAELYGGSFLPSVRLVESNALQTWVDLEGARLARLNRKARREHVAELRAAYGPDGAVPAARRWAELDPFEDEAQHALISLLADSGQRAEALRHYGELVELLRREQLTPLEETSALVERLRGEAHARVETPADAGATHVPGPDAPGASSATRRMPPVTVVGAAAAFLIFGAGALSRFVRDDAETMTDSRVLVVPFENATGDSTMAPVGDLAADWISEGLARTGYLRVVPAVEVMRRLQSVGASTDAERAAAAFAMARDVGAGLLVSGRYYRSGDSLELHAQIAEVATGELWLALEPQGAAADAPGAAIQTLRERIVGTLAARASEDVPLEPPSVSYPPTYDAWLAYHRGAGRFIRGDFAGAVPDLLSATALDTGFVRPLLLAASAYGNMGDVVREDSIIRVLAERADRLGPYERAHLEYEQSSLAGDLDGAYRAARRVAELAPGAPGHYVLAGLALTLGRPWETIAILDSLDPSPPWLPVWWSRWPLVTGAWHAMEDHQAELAAALESAREGRSAGTGLFELRALVALGRIDEALARLDAWIGVRSDVNPDALLEPLAAELMRHGHEEAARAVLDRALARVEAVRTSGTPEGESARAVRTLLLAGRLEPAGSLVAELRADRPGSVEYLGLEGVLAASRDDRAGADRIAEALTMAGGPYVRGADRYWRAAIAARLGDEAGAIERLRAARDEGFGLGFRMHADPLFRSLWAHPAYEALVVEPR